MTTTIRVAPLLLLVGTAISFAPSSPPPPLLLLRQAVVVERRAGAAGILSGRSPPPPYSHHSRGRRGGATALLAGGFEWEDPTSEIADPGVENPYKNPDLLLSSSSDSSSDSSDPSDPSSHLRVDPARLLAPRLRGTNIYLVGMMGSGKSVVGDAIARRMGTYNFLDTDVILERAAGMTIRQMFAEEDGEESFREAEARVLDSVHAHVRCVVGTGGGIVLRNQNWSKLRTGLVVYLKVEPDVIYDRIRGNVDRPLLSNSDDPLGTLTRLIEERRGRYEQADVIVEVTANMDVRDVADACVRALHDFIDDNPPAWMKAKEKARAEGGGCASWEEEEDEGGGREGK
ncbi:hypothetical protein ACHAW5_003628 [Stephanodiscus triporus]|uniref:Shikimate kinase n=1 Tax=Stephanodiscus triporus TaxID=2934178 RepID=A0ABD3QY82_9STRA